MLHNFVNKNQWPYKGLTYPSFPTPSSFIANNLNVGPIPILLFAMAPPWFLEGLLNGLLVLKVSSYNEDRKY
jgi:hypothetical protein